MRDGEDKPTNLRLFVYNESGILIWVVGPEVDVYGP